MPVTKRNIFCAGCNKIVLANLTTGKEIYPNYPSLAQIPFWQCPNCNNYVGCHHKSRQSHTVPLGVIPTPKIRKLRRRIHKVLDPLWREGLITRNDLYKQMTQILGVNSYHTGNIKSVEEAQSALRVAHKIKEQLTMVHQNKT